MADMPRALSMPPQRYYRIAVSVFYFIQGLVFASWASRIPDIQSSLGLGDGALGAWLLALPAGQLCAMPFSGYGVGKWGSKKMLFWGVWLYPLGLLLLGLVKQPWQLGAALFLFGVFGNMSNIAINTQGIGVERLYRRSIMASFHGLWSLAGFTGGLVAAGMVALNVGPLGHFLWIYGCVALLWTLASRYVVPRDATVPPKPTGSGPSRRLPFNKHILLLGIIAFACMMSEGTMFDWSGIYYEKVVGVPSAWIRLGYVAFMSTMALGRFVSDAWVTRWGARTVLQASGALIALGMMMSVAFPHIAFATLGFLLIGIGTSSVVPLVYSMAGKVKGIAPGAALAAVSSVGFLGFLIGPPLVGFLSEISGLRMAFACIALLGLCIVGLARFFGTSDT